MALIKCPECGKEISDKSKACIHCGYPIDELDKTYEEDSLITVPVHREKRFTGSFLTSLILVNDVQKGSVKSGGSCEFQVKPGLSIITIKTGNQSFWEGGNVTTTQYLIKPNMDLYIELSSGWGVGIKSIIQK